MEGSNDLRNDRHDRFWTGLILVIIGGALLAEKMGAPLPPWLFTWPMILIIVGLVTGIRHRFWNLSWIVITGIGVFFLMDEILEDMTLKHYFWPVMIIALGVVYMLRPKRDCMRRMRDRSYKWREMEDRKNSTATTGSSEDMINSVSVFGGVKKVVTTKNFKGGEVICLMGGAEINLSQADITGTVSIEITQVFGGTKLVVPPHWDVRSESIAIFAGIEDKRPVQPGSFDPNKVLILRGTTVFGGIDIRSY